MRNIILALNLLITCILYLNVAHAGGNEINEESVVGLWIESESNKQPSSVIEFKKDGLLIHSLMVLLSYNYRIDDNK